MTSDELRASIKRMRKTAPPTKVFEKRENLQGVKRVWYRSQKEHWLGWLAEYDGAKWQPIGPAATLRPVGRMLLSRQRKLLRLRVAVLEPILCNDLGLSSGELRYAHAREAGAR